MALLDVQKVKINGLEIGANFSDGFNFTLAEDGLKGWFEPSNRPVKVTQLVRSDGARISDATLDGKVVSVDVWVTADNSEDLLRDVFAFYELINRGHISLEVYDSTHVQPATIEGGAIVDGGVHDIERVNETCYKVGATFAFPDSIQQYGAIIIYPWNFSIEGGIEFPLADGQADSTIMLTDEVRQEDIVVKEPVIPQIYFAVSAYKIVAEVNGGKIVCRRTRAPKYASEGVIITPEFFRDRNMNYTDFNAYYSYMEDDPYIVTGENTLRVRAYDEKGDEIKAMWALMWRDGGVA